MSDVSKKSPPPDPALRKAMHQAAAWIAHIHGPGRTPESEQGLRDWLAEDPLHMQAFERATDLWNQHRAIVRHGAKIKLLLPGDREERRSPVLLRVVCVGVLALLLVIGVFYASPQSHAYSTALAERHNFRLEDGTSVDLNTQSRIFKEYSSRERRIRWESGEAVFDVAKKTNWPFVVLAGDRKVTAVGTSFHMRVEGDYVAVALIEGTITVTSDASPSAPVYTLSSPGQRLMFRGRAQQPEPDTVSLGKLTAWQRGWVDLDDLRLVDAVREMNRYSIVRLRVEARNWERVRVGGVFKVGDSLSFARYVATKESWRVEERSEEIVLKE